MIISEKTKRRFRCLAASLIIMLIVPICERQRAIRGAEEKVVFSGKELICAINLGDDMLGSHGLETGFTYEMVKRFALDNNCVVRTVVQGRDENYVDSLVSGKIDILISHHEDIAGIPEIKSSINLSDCSVMAVCNDEEGAKIKGLNDWIGHITSTKEFDKAQKRYKGVFNPHKRVEKGLISNRVSPYDELIRKHAKTLGWDWRMLAAVVYQESKFSINSTSHRGAAGLMQVMPSTAAKYGVTDLLDPENNLSAGTQHLLRLQNIWKRRNLTSEELIRFTLASYNAGEGRILDCRNFAASKGYDNSRWSDVVKVIPLMREDSILSEESVKLGKFQGYETINYVESVMSLYEAICIICPEA